MRSAQETQQVAAEMVAEMRALLHGRRIRIMEVCGTHTVAISVLGCGRFSPRALNSSQARAAPSV